MITFTRHKEQSLIVGETLRLLVLHHDRDQVRLGFDRPTTGIGDIDIRPEERWTPGCRRDLVAWHPDPLRLLEQIACRFPNAVDDLRIIRSGLAYIGHDPCIVPLLEAYVQGLRDSRQLTG